MPRRRKQAAEDDAPPAMPSPGPVPRPRRRPAAVVNVVVTTAGVEECAHPPQRRDLKNKRLCRACGQPVPEGVK